MRHNRRLSITNGFTVSSEIKYYKTFIISPNERIVYVYSTKVTDKIPIYFINDKKYFVNGEECPMIPIRQNKNSDTKTIEFIAHFDRNITNIERYFNTDLEKITGYKSVASIKKYEIVKIGKYPHSSQTYIRLNDFAEMILNKVKEAKNKWIITKTETKHNNL